MKSNRPFNVLDDVAKDHIPDNTNLAPRLAARLERKSPMAILCTRPIVAILLALLTLLALSGAVYALGHSLGYIPGYGVVDQNVQMLVLAEPVSQTRDGVVITIEELILTPDKLYVTASTENIPNASMLPMSDTTTARCIGNWVYQLPDGTPLTPDLSGPSGGTMDDPWSNNNDLTRTSYRGRSYFTLATPLDLNGINELILHVPCITSDLTAGSTPENWEFRLRLIPAPAEMLAMTAMPVLEYTPAPTPTLPSANVTEQPEATPTLEANPITITKVIDTGDGYILMGEIAPPPGSVSDGNSELMLFDATGKQIIWDMPMDINLGTPTAQTPFAGVFAMHFNKAEITALPLTIKLAAKKWAETPLRLEFDAGENPQPGDEWQVNQPFEVSGHTITLNAIRVIPAQMPANAGGFQFALSFSDADISATPSIEGFTSMNEGFGGGGGGALPALPSPQWNMNYNVEFTSMPKGRVIIKLLVRVVDSEQSWTLQWQP